MPKSVAHINFGNAEFGSVPTMFCVKHNRLVMVALQGPNAARPSYIHVLCSCGRRYSYIIYQQFTGAHFCGNLMLRIFQLVWNLEGYSGLGLYLG
jgi:hypothetical protein